MNVFDFITLPKEVSDKDWIIYINKASEDNIRISFNARITNTNPEQTNPNPYCDITIPRDLRKMNYVINDKYQKDNEGNLRIIHIDSIMMSILSAMVKSKQTDSFTRSSFENFYLKEYFNISHSLRDILSEYLQYLCYINDTDKKIKEQKLKLIVATQLMNDKETSIM